MSASFDKSQFDPSTWAEGPPCEECKGPTRLSPWSKTPWCTPCGERVAKEREAEKQRKREAEERYERAKLLQRWIPPAYNRSLFASYACPPGDADALARVKAWQVGDRGLYLWGRMGVGKSHLAFALARREILAGRRGVVVARWVDHLAQIRASFGGGDEPPDLADAASSLLVLDEIAGDRMTEWSLEALFRVVDAAEAHCIPLVVTSNLNRAELHARMSRIDEVMASRIASRLHGLCDALEVRGPDHRLTRSES